MGIIAKFTGNTQLVDIEEGIKYLQLENAELKKTTTFLLSLVQRQEAQFSVINSKIDDVIENVTKTSVGVEEVKTTDFYGKKVVFLPEAVEAAEKMSNTEIRSLIRKAARVKGGKSKGFTYIYNKLEEVTGVNVYNLGKTSLNKNSGIEGWKKDASFINTILLKGIQKEAAVICKEILIKQ